MDSEILDRLEAELTPGPLSARPDGPLFHYTGAAGLHGILSGKVIWATDYRYLNDSVEVVTGERLLLEVAEALSGDPRRADVSRWLLREFIARYPERRLTTVRDVFVASFSERGDLLSQWRAYAGGAGGYSIGLSHIPTPAPTAAPDAKIGWDLIRCEYREDVLRQQASERLGSLADRFGAEAHAHARDERDCYRLAGLFVPLLFRHTAVLALHLKDVAFEEEREWRLVAVTTAHDPAVALQYRFSPAGLVPYITLRLSEPESSPLALSKVYVGPTQDPERERSTAVTLLKRLGYRGQDIVVPSAIPLRERA